MPQLAAARLFKLEFQVDGDESTSGDRRRRGQAFSISAATRTITKSQEDTQASCQASFEGPNVAKRDGSRAHKMLNGACGRYAETEEVESQQFRRRRRRQAAASSMSPVGCVNYYCCFPLEDGSKRMQRSEASTSSERSRTRRRRTSNDDGKQVVTMRSRQGGGRHKSKRLPTTTLPLLSSLLAVALFGSLASCNNTPPSAQTIEGCKFYPLGENRRFERVAENLPVGSEIFKLEAHPRSEFRIEPIDNSLSDVNYFKFVDLDDRFVAIKLNASLEELVDRRDPQNVLKFKLTCRGIGSQEDSFLPVTVYIHDVNDHAPEFQNVPYHLEVDELTPVGLTIFRSIHAIDRDKPNTANSDITYSIVGGNENDSFILSDPIEGILVMNKALDYDHGKREYKIQIQASDHGSPSLSSVTTMTVKVKDADDQNPIFSHEIYTASVSESAQITGKRVREKVRVEPAIVAYDQDAGINARLRYSIVLGNEGGFFEMNAQTGELFLIREIDLEKLATQTLSLQIQVSQVDNPLRQALARVDILVQDINDNSPEFEYDMYNITVIENLPPNFTVLQVFASDTDQGENAQFKYVLHDDSGAFKIDPTSGWISVKDPTRLDRETTDHIRMHVTTVEQKPNVNPDISKRKRGTSVEINLLDSNDNTPFFVGAASQRQRAGQPGDSSAGEAEQSPNCLNVLSASGGGGGETSDCVVPINLYNFNVLETATPGTQIGHVYAYDRDLADNGRVQYFKQNDSISLGAPFDVNPQNGSIFVLPQFTRLARKQSSYTLFVKAIDSAQIHFERRHSVAVIQVNVTDINNSVPEFVGATPFEAYVGESLPEGAFVSQIQARDDDSVTEQLEYSIVAGNGEKLFMIDSKLGKIYTSAVLDYERKQSYDLLVQVSDGVNTAVAPLMVNIIDINDQQPLFAHQFYNFTVVEEGAANQTVGQLQALDRDSGKNAQLSYSLVGEQAQDAFLLEPKTGLLRTRRPLDAEVEPVIDFQVVARDGGVPQLSGSASVRVRVQDINDWAPRFEQARYELDVQEELEPPVDVAQLKAHDRDRDENAAIKYLILGGNEQQLFTINADTGLLSTAARLNFEARREHRLQVAARNVHPFQGPQARQIVNPAVEITIRVGDINDELLAFERQAYNWKLSELTAKGTIVGRVNASNLQRAPQEQEVVYWLGQVQVVHAAAASGGSKRKSNATSEQETPPPPPKSASSLLAPNTKFSVDEKSGEIVLLDSLDRDAPKNEHQFRFQVFARDKRSINKQNASVAIVIDVLDVNDNAPQFDEQLYQLEMPENLPAGTTIPAFFKVSDLDSGLNGRIASYHINGSQEEQTIFHVNNVTGTITLRNSLDFERKSVHKFDLLAFDGGQPQALVGSAKVVVQVANINEFSPKFLNLPYEYLLQENAVPGTQVGQVKAVDLDGNKIVYSISDGDTEFFAIEQSTGKIYVNRQLVPRTSYNFVVRATDDGQPQNYSLGVQVVIRVRDTNDFAPVFGSNSYLGQVVEKSARSPAGSAVLVKVEAQDKDLQNNTISYSIVGGNDEKIFQIDKRSGELRVAQNSAPKIDFDKRKQYTLLVQAQDSHDLPLTGLTMVQVNVVDVNDHAPVFSKAAYVASVVENAAAGNCFARVEADSRDADDGIQYSLSSSSSASSSGAAGAPSARPQTRSSSATQASIAAADPINQLFEIHPTRGTICTKMPLDREQRASYELTVTAFDGRFESQAAVSVEILDENDNRPLFDSDQYVASLPYDSQPGRTVAQVHASDADANSNGLVQYWIKNTHGLFQIDAKTGQVRLVARLPAPASGAQNQTQTFELRVFAQDQGSSAQIGETSLLIKLTNSENHPPKFDKFAYQVAVDENVSGVPLIQVQASDPDAGKAGRIVYRLARVQTSAWMAQRQSSAAAAAVSKGNKLQAAAAEQQVAGQQGDSAASNLDYLRSAFKIDKASGRIVLVEPLDYEETHNVELVVEARDEGDAGEAQVATAFVQVQVNDVNDNRPEFLAVPKLLRVSSSTQPNSEVIYTLQALDADSSRDGNNQIEYKLETSSRFFNVHPQTGVLFAIAPLPTSLAEGGQTPPELEAERLAGGATLYSEALSVVAQDKSTSAPLSDRLQFELEVYRDQADDAHPIFSSNQYFVQSESAIEPGTVILVPKATVPNGDSIVYNISAIESQSGSAKLSQQHQRQLMKRFAIDTESGRISTTSRLEPNELISRNVYHFVVRATNQRQPLLSNEAGVIVRLWDTASRCPRFPFTEYYASVAESARIDSVAVANLVIDDVERFAGQKLSYQITEDNSNDNFFIDVSSATSGGGARQAAARISVSLRVKKPLDRETMPKFLGGVYTLTVSASNSKCSTQAKVKILVEDMNDNSPTFERQDYQVEVRENSPAGHVVVQLQAQDADELDAQRLRYFIADGGEQVFEMEQKTGTVSVRSELDREKAASYSLKIMAVDLANNTGWTNLQVQVLDENDWAPTFQNETFYMNTTEGPSSLGTRIRLPVFDYDDGPNRQMEVYIVDGNSANEFRLDVDEGGPLLTVVQELDWEKYSAGGAAAAQQASTVATHQIQIAAKDKGQPARVGKTNVIVYIHDVNDNAPKFTHESYYEFIDENAPLNSIVATVRATDADSAANTNLTYSFVRRSGPATPSSAAAATPTRRSQAAGGGSGGPSPVGLIARPRQLRPNRLRKRQAPQPPPTAPFPFALDPKTGVVSVARQLDISEQQQYLLTIEAYDGLWRTETQMRVFVNEVEDPRDVSARSAEATNHYRFQVMENLADALVGAVDLKPRKLRVNSQIKYSIVNVEMRQVFRITEGGEIFTLASLDREQRAQYTFTVMLEERRASSKLTVAEVIVDVLDENDQIPTFMHVYHGSIKENSPPGAQVFLLPTSAIRAVDSDTRNNSQISYSLSGAGSERFEITPSGSIVFADESGLQLDRELRAEYKLDVHATDAGNLSSKTSLTIRVDDENDNAPVFETGPLFVIIPETARPGSKLIQVRARDRDEPGPNSEIHYKISASTSGASGGGQPPALNDVIRIDQASGELFVVGQLQPASTYNITVTAADSGGLATQTQVNVTVLDVNDHKPVFEKSAYSFVVFEANYTRGALKLATLRATDNDLGRNSQIEYLLLTDPQYEASLPVASPANQLASLFQQRDSNSQQQQQQSGFPISIDVHTGELFARGPIDREQRDTFVFKVMAVDLGEPPLNSTCEVTVKVKDTNDEPPRFYTDPYLALVPENLEPGHKVTQIAAFDPDSGENGQVFYKLGEGHEGKFYIDSKDGTVWTLASLDYEQKNFYNITIVAYDRGQPSLHSTAKLWITVADMNDAVPNFAKAVYTLEVAENSKLGDTIFTLNAGKGAFKYSWLERGAQLGAGSGGGGERDSGPPAQAGADRHAQLDDGTDTFSVEPNSGHIKLAKPLDSVQRNHYRLMVRAQDESEPPKFDTAEINILVGTGQGVRLFAQRVYEVSVLENQLAPLHLIDLNCTDEIIHQPAQYSIVGSDHRGLFRVEPDTGRVSVAQSLDRERRESYVIKVKAETGNLNVRQKRQAPQAAAPAAAQVAGPTQHGRWSASSLQPATGGSGGGGGGQAAAASRKLAADLNELEQRFYGQGARLIAANSAAAATNASLLQSLHLAYDETFVLISVDDENDNAPVFGNKAKPIVSAVPLEASFGYEVARVVARDADAALNGQVRYELQSRNDDASTKFYIDPSSGVVRSMVNFALDSGRVYNFDVRAVDRDGAPDGNSASVQVFVYVLPETKMVLMVTDTEPIVMERRSHELIGYLSNVTGFEVKLAKLEPHIEGEAPEPFSTDLFLYAVNPSLNNIVDTETLLNVFRQSSQTILSHLHSFKIRRIQGVTVQEKISQMGATEVAIIALSSIVFVGSIVAILLLCSCKSAASASGGAGNGPARNLSSGSSERSIWEHHTQQRGYGLKNPLMAGLGGGAKSAAAAAAASAVGGRSPAQLAALRQPTSQSTYSTGDGANSSEYVDSLISYKRSSGASRTKQSQLGAGGRAKARNADWSAIDSDLAAVMNEHHLHHHLHHHSGAAGAQPTQPPGVASAIGGLPQLGLKGPRARLARSRSPDADDPNCEVHSDNEIFGDEEDEEEAATAAAAAVGANQTQAEQSDAQRGAGSVRSADRSMYSGDSNWDSGDDEAEPKPAGPKLGAPHTHHKHHLHNHHHHQHRHQLQRHEVEQ